MATFVLTSLPALAIALAWKMTHQPKGRHRGRPQFIWKEIG